MVDTAPEEYKFTSDTQHLLSLVIHSLYCKTDVCIRELISNASDALDKIRFKSLTDTELMADDPNLRIDIIPQPDEKILKIIDTGIGLTKSEMIKYLGEIAKSGTRAFAQAIEKSNSDKTNLIGQFGIGFYSAFLISDRVTVVSKSPYDDAVHEWESDASTTFKINQVERSDLKRGTEISLHIKEGKEDFLKDSFLKNTIKRDSSYISYPIYIHVPKTKEVDDSEDEDNDNKADTTEKKEEDGALEEVKKDADEKKEKKKKTLHYVDEEHINSEPRIWAKDPKEITEEEYTKAYKSLTKSWEAPFLAQVHHVEGVSSFKIFIAMHKRPKTDIYTSSTEPGSPHAKLFHKGVYLMDFNKQNHFYESPFQSMFYVVLDVEDLPTQISRETVVSAKFLKLFQKFTKNKIFAMIEEVRKDAEKWKELLKNQEKNLKLMAYEDATRGIDVLKLIDFKVSTSDEPMTLEQYEKIAKELKQDQIYYLSGTSDDALKNDKTVLALKELKKPVILIKDPLDEVNFQKHREFASLKFQDISKEGFKMNNDEEHKAKYEKYTEEYKEFCTKAKGILTGIVSDVKVKDNFVGPYTIQVPDHGLSANMENLQKNQPMAQNQMAFFNQSMKVLAINPEAKEVQWMKEKIMSDSPIGIHVLKIAAQISLIRKGYSLDDTEGFCDQITKMLAMASEDAPAESAVPIKVSEEGESALDQVD